MWRNWRQVGLTVAVVAVLLATGCKIVRGILALVIAIVILSGFIGAALRGELGPPPVPTPIGSRTLIGGTLPLREYWRRSRIVLPFYDERMVVSDEYVCLVTYSFKGWHQVGWLQVLKARSGETLWEVTQFPDVVTLATDGRRLFVITRRELQSYDLARGELLWRTSEHMRGYAKYGFQSVGEDILIYFADDISWNRREQTLLRYDAQNGTVKEMNRFEVPPNVRLILTSSSTNYWTDGDRIWAEDRASHQVRWQVGIERRLDYWPVLSGSSLIYASGFYPRLYAVDTATGILQWMYTDPLVSNFVLGDNILYTIRQDGALVGIDPRTGQEIGRIQFSPAETEKGSPRSIVYWVAASDNYVFVYFGDSQELIALGP